MNRKSQFCTLNLSAGEAPPTAVLSCAARSRIEQAFSHLQNIQFARDNRKDPYFGRSTENRIVWRELLELELQEVEEQFERIGRLREVALSRDR
jgi:hypothetical protein